MKNYTIQVIGRIWSGAKCAYEYGAVNKPVGIDEVKKVAGDFQRVADRRIAERDSRAAGLAGHSCYLEHDRGRHWLWR